MCFKSWALYSFKEHIKALERFSKWKMKYINDEISLSDSFNIQSSISKSSNSNTNSNYSIFSS